MDVADGGDLGDFGCDRCNVDVGGETRQHGLRQRTTGLHCTDALGVDGTGEDDMGCCALSSVPGPGLSAYISSECDVTYAVLGNSNVSLNEIGFATATTSTNNRSEQQTQSVL